MWGVVTTTTTSSASASAVVLGQGGRVLLPASGGGGANKDIEIPGERRHWEFDECVETRKIQEGGEAKPDFFWGRLYPT